jgi:hypothetical protein
MSSSTSGALHLHRRRCLVLATSSQPGIPARCSVPPFRPISRTFPGFQPACSSCCCPIRGFTTRSVCGSQPLWPPCSPGFIRGVPDSPISPRSPPRGPSRRQVILYREFSPVTSPFSKPTLLCPSCSGWPTAPLHQTEPCFAYATFLPWLSQPHASPWRGILRFPPIHSRL